MLLPTRHTLMTSSWRIITALALGMAFISILYPSFAPAWGQANRTSDTDLLEEKLRLIDERGQSTDRRTFQIRATSTVVKPKDIYSRYQQLAAALTAKLIRIKREAEQSNSSYSLQRLAAISHSVSVEHEALHVELEGGETQFQSYRLIQRAVLALEEATDYWRESNKAKDLGRGSQQEETMDQELIRLKLQTAMSAIDELQQFDKVRNTLDQNIKD